MNDVLEFNEQLHIMADIINKSTKEIFVDIQTSNRDDYIAFVKIYKLKEYNGYVVTENNLLNSGYIKDLADLVWWFTQCYMDFQPNKEKK